MRKTPINSCILSTILLLGLSQPCPAATTKEEITRLINEGISYHSSRNYLLAIKSFKEALALEPTNEQILKNISIAHNNYGKYLAERTDGTGAAREFRNALYYDSKNDVARGNLEYKIKDLNGSTTEIPKRIDQARQERNAENFFAAIAEAREANRIKENVEAWLEIGSDYHMLSLKYPQEESYTGAAIDAFTKASKLNPDDPRPYMRLGDVHVAQGKINQGIDYYEQAIKKDPENTEAQSALVNGWLAAIRIAPHLANNHVGLGTAYQLRGDFLQAERSFVRALEIDANNLLAKKGIDSLREDRVKTQVNLFLDRAVVLQQRGNYDESLVNYIKALNLEPTNPDIHYNIGTAFQAKNDIERARKAYNKAIELYPGHTEAKKALASLEAQIAEKQVVDAFAQAVQLQKAGKYQEAANIYEKIAVDKPQDDTVFYNLAIAYQALGNYDKSIENYMKAAAIKNDPSYAEAIRSIEIAKANDLLTKAIEAQSKADNQGAISMYKEVVAIVPNNAGAWYNLGTAYQATGKDLDALAAYQKAYGLDEANQTEAVFFAALILEDQRKFLDATALYEKYLKLAPTGDYANDAKQRQAYIKSLL